jgi:superfamily II DNA or RNA helicase
MTEIKKTSELTLRDRLSRLTYIRARDLLGKNGDRLIREGGKFEIDIDEQVVLENDRFLLTFPEATVKMDLDPASRDRIRWSCSLCTVACEHAGAAFSLILEEKTALGLAAPPTERVPIEALSEEELVQLALEERLERARNDKMTLKSSNPKVLWADYTCTSALSGKTYRMALRGWERGESYCSCPDFRKNTLGTCKHILSALQKVKSRFPAQVRNRPYVRRRFAVHLRYAREIELRMLMPGEMDSATERIANPLRNTVVTDVHNLLNRIRKLERRGHDVHLHPDAEEYIQKQLLLERLSAVAEGIRKKPESHPLRGDLLKTELLPYQLDGIAFAVGAGRAILADDMGLGKTIQGIGVAELLAREAGIGKVLVICPASLKSQWRSEIHRFSDRGCQLVLGSAKERPAQYAGNTFFTVCNYEQALRDILAIEPVKWDLIILDEGQRIKNWEAKTSRTVKALRSPFALALTGTPLENRLDDLYSVVEFVDERRLGPAFRFFNRHRMVNEKGKVLGYRNLNELRKGLTPVLLRRTRDEVMKQLPPRVTEIVRIPPTDEQLQIHGAHMRIVGSIVRKKYLTEMDLLRLQKALLMCRRSANGTYLVDRQEPGYSSKLEHLAELLGQLESEKSRKTVLFSEWTTMLDLVEPLIDKLGIGYVRLDGSVPQKKRQGLVHEFQNNRDCRLFITTNAGSTGLNLQAANTVINVDLPWNPAVLEQRISRAHRMGQHRSVQVYVLITEQTIEENLLQALSSKHNLALAALDAESDVDQVDMISGMEELKRRLEVLLGARPEAAVDESEKTKRQQEVALTERRDRIAAAGGQLLTSAFSFLGEIIPEREETEESKRMAETLRARLSECMDRDENGKLKLTVCIPDEAVLDNLAGALSRLLLHHDK